MTTTTRSAIVSPSSNEWSPLRTGHKKSVSAIYSPSPSAAVSYSQINTADTPAAALALEHPSLHSPKQVTQNFKALRTHGLVSNSIFKQIDSPTSVSPLSISPKKKQQPQQQQQQYDGLPSPSELGVGTSTPTRQQRRASQEQRVASIDENTSPYTPTKNAAVGAKAERKIPRKSLGRLHESHHVSNSVFRQPGDADDCSTAPSTTGTPTKGLLTSNRLHGPRFMASAHGSPSNVTVSSPTTTVRHERRKTVTFDEILDVQEFEHEASFDTSTSSVVPTSDSDAVPAVASSVSSVDDSEPELDASRDDDDDESSDNSRDTCSAEGPHGSEAFASGTHLRLSAAERVDSMMNELLSQDILNSPSVRPGDELVAMPEALTSATATAPHALPFLPAWTPLDLNVDVKSVQPLTLNTTEDVMGRVHRSSTQPHIPDLAVATAPATALGATDVTPKAAAGKTSGRPHISRDAILQRVALEKAKEHAVSSSTIAGGGADSTAAMVAAVSRTPTRMARGSEPAARRRPHPAPTSSTPPPQLTHTSLAEHKTSPAPSPVKQALEHIYHVQSPLESLGTELQNAYPFGSDPLQTSPPSPSSSSSPSAAAVVRGPAAARRKRSMSTSDSVPHFAEHQRQVQDTDVDAAVKGGIDATQPPKLTARKSIGADLAKSKQMLDASVQRAIDGGFQRTLEQEFSKITSKEELPYKVKDCGSFHGVDDKVTHSATAGDVDTGKAWKKVRRPSDMHEYKTEMRELHEASQQQARPLPGKVFVLVDSFTPLDLPVPTTRPTMFHCILDNGLHMVKTATVPLRPGRGNTSPIGQEFELIQHRNLEFSLTLVVQRDAHLVEPSVPLSPTRKEHTSPTLKGFSRFFSSPKKQAALKREQQLVATQQPTRAEPMLAYMNREGAFGRTGIVFERVMQQCTATCLVIDLPVHGASNPAMSASGPSASIASRSMQSNAGDDYFRANLGKVRGTLRLKLFYLPPLPTVPRDRLPESLADCVQGMKDAAWHRAAEPWFSGTLTQLGGDCASWRRRPTKAQGQFLICFSTVTKKPTVKIDLSKAVCVEEIGNHVTTGSMIFPASRQSQMTMTRTRTVASHTTLATNDDEDADANYHVDRSFRITFEDGERIDFFADTEEEKVKWVQVVTDLIDAGVPANPLWAQAVLETLQVDAAPIIDRRPGQTVSQRLTSTLTEEDEGGENTPAPATPQKDNAPARVHHQRAQSASVNSSSPLVETPRRLGSNRPTSRIPAPPRTPTTTASEIVLSTRTSSSMLASPRRMAASEIRVTVNDPSNRAAFDRLKRAADTPGHHRSRTEDLTAAARRY